MHHKIFLINVTKHKTFHLVTQWHITYITVQMSKVVSSTPANWYLVISPFSTSQMFWGQGGQEVDGTGSGLCPMAGFGVEPSGSATRVSQFRKWCIWATGFHSNSKSVLAAYVRDENLKYKVSPQRLELIQLRKCYAYQIYLTAKCSAVSYCT